MAYRGAKVGQTVYYARNHWETRRPVVLLRYYKFHPDLKHDNCAVIQDGGIRLNVDIKDLYRKAE